MNLVASVSEPENHKELYPDFFEKCPMAPKFILVLTIQGQIFPPTQTLSNINYLLTMSKN
jgi:hypothetical protein